MKSRAKVVWEEGMYLGPHQFQAQAGWVEDSLSFVVSALCPFQFGFTGFELDAPALRNGTVSLLHARGIFPDGTPFNLADHVDLPPARSIADFFPPTASGVLVSLAIPTHRPNSPNLNLSVTAAGSSLPVRYLAEKQILPDENSGSDERPVLVARKNVRLLLDTDSGTGEGESVLPLARVCRDGSGHFRYDPEFIPPCLQTSASETLMKLLQRLIEILSAKSAALGGYGKARNYSDSEVENFWRRHAVNSALTPLTHEFVSRRGHPVALFIELSRLGGALCTFSLNSNPTSLPSYDHCNPGPGFFALDAHIRKILDLVVATNCLELPLRKTVENQWATGEIADTRCFNRSDWILGIRSTIGDMSLITQTPQLVKICSEKFVGELVRRGVAGLALRHLPVPPSAIPLRAETQYFSISKQGPCWESITSTRAAGIYAPADHLPNAELELFALLDG